MAIIKSISETTLTVDYPSAWWNSKHKSNPEKGSIEATKAPTPKGFNIQVGIADIVGSPDEDSKIQIFTTVNGQTETLYYEQAITEENADDSFLFENVQGHEFQVKIGKGGMVSYTPIIDYSVIY